MKFHSLRILNFFLVRMKKLINFNNNGCFAKFSYALKKEALRQKKQCFFFEKKNPGKLSFEFFNSYLGLFYNSASFPLLHSVKWLKFSIHSVHGVKETKFLIDQTQSPCPHTNFMEKNIYFDKKKISSNIQANLKQF